MVSPPSFTAVVDPVISLLPSAALRDPLRRAFSEEEAAVAGVEEVFRLLPTSAWSRDLRCTFAGSWKATHLKMLAIYGLTCRLQRAAERAGATDGADLHLAAARNASTSHEDLGLDFDGQTHAELYDRFAGALTGGDLWQLGRYRLPEAQRFSRWVYRNMVVEPIADGLLTNLFSEIYNHGEYSIALPAAGAYFERRTGLTPKERSSAVTYVAAHVEGEVEAAHFLVVVEALDRYLAATGTRLDPDRAAALFRTYLRGIAEVMGRLSERMHHELGEPAAEHAQTAGGA